jgi:addiction module RelE/StbE family toxin
MRTLSYSKQFKKDIKKLNSNEKRITKEKIKLFKTGKFDKELKVHPLKYDLLGKFASWVKHDLRVVFSIINNDIKIYFLEQIGGHSKVYKKRLS